MNEELPSGEGRRAFMKRALLLASFLPAIVALNDACQAQPQRQASQRALVGGGCEGCEGIYEGQPQQLSWQTAIASSSEPGERMEISGRIFQIDGRTPAPNIILYVYHTDAKGYYSPAPDATNNARRHGHLRGWMKTNEKGEYRFSSIKPASYPEGRNPAHIHPIVKEPDKNEYYIDEYLFDDDPFLTGEYRSRLENRGGPGVIRLVKREDGVWTGKRDIILGMNVPNYR